MKPPWDVGMKICSNVPGHMTKMASRPIYGNNFKTSPSSEQSGRWPWNLVYVIGYSSTTKFVQLMILDWPWPFLWHDQICFLMLLHGWKLIQHIVMYFKLILIQHIPSTQVSDTGPLVLWFHFYFILNGNYIPPTKKMLVTLAWFSRSQHCKESKSEHCLHSIAWTNWWIVTKLS